MSTKAFIYEQQPARIIFDSPVTEALTHQLQDETSTKAWIIASHRHDSLVKKIGEITSIDLLEHFSRVLQHVPQDQVQKARHAVAKSRPDIIIAIGGGSAIGLAKAVALKHPLPIWAVPTTYSGSEMTSIYGISSAGKKEVGRDKRVTPSTVIYDIELSLTLPFDSAAKSAINALAHLVEAAYSPGVNPFTFSHTLKGLELMMDGLYRLADANELTADINRQLLLGACFAGKSLSEAEMGLHHKCAHVLGGSYGLDHSSVHTVLLPYVLSYQWDSLSNDLKDHFKKVFKSDSPAQTLLDLISNLKQPTSLKEIGFDRSSASEAAEEVCGLNFKSPAPISKMAVQALLENA